VRLIIATLQDYDAPGLLRELTARGLGATQIASTGGALRSGTITLLVGVPESQVRPVLRLIDEHTQATVEQFGAEPPGDDEGWYPPGLGTAKLGGAIVSVLKVVRFERL
jgi:uncharacterized protein YaaQ